METIREISGNINSAVCKQIPEKGLNEDIFLCLLFQANRSVCLFLLVFKTTYKRKNGNSLQIFPEINVFKDNLK